MEAILVDSVQHSLRDFMYRNAIFICERLCAEFPSETNLQLLASCYLRNNQTYAAYHILKGTRMAQSRYLFALSCFQMDFLKEAEAALCPVNEPSSEVPNGAAGQYLLGLIYRYTDRRKGAIHYFKQALLLDPLMWAAYEELCLLGAADEGSVAFGDTAALCLQKHYQNHGLTSQNLLLLSEDHTLVSGRKSCMEDASPRHMKNIQGNISKDIPRNYHNSTVLGGASSQPLSGSSSNISFYNTPSPMGSHLSSIAPPPLHRNGQQSGPSLSMSVTDSSPKSSLNFTIQAPRRKVVDEGKFRKV